MARPVNVNIRRVVRWQYTNGKSTRAIAKMLKKSNSYIGHIVKELGISRERSLAVHLASPAKSTHWRSKRSAARRKYERENSIELSSNIHVHHVDEDFTNNSINNLEALEASVHLSLHNRGPYYGTPRHLRPHRKSYMSEYNKNVRRVLSNCVACNREFMKDKYDNKYGTCSRKCTTLFLRGM